MNFKTAINQFLSNKYSAFALTVVIFILCSWPSKELPKVVGIYDKVYHFLAFSAWAFFWQAAFGNYTKTLIAGIFYGIFIEFWQAILPESFHRGFDWYDALADTIGVIIGLILWKIKTLLRL